MTEGMRPDGPDNHPLMAELYDLENTWGDDDDFFLALVGRRPGSRVADLGCGTGRFTVALAQAGHRVTGVEPNPAFLAAARAKPGSELVQWIEGTSSDLATASFDVVVMTSHVVQAFVADDEWMALLSDLRRALVPGGMLAFDSRDPDAQGWEAWIGGWRGELGDGAFESRSDAVAVSAEDGLVTFEVDTVLPGGERRRGISDYRFRPRAELVEGVERAGFRIDEVHGGWHGEPVGGGVGEIVVVATRA